MELKWSDEMAPVATDQVEQLARACLHNAEVEHIGSSAIAGVKTKGDVDVLIRVAADRHSESVRYLTRHGFSVKEDTHRDQHLCMLVADQNPLLALQVIARGSRYEFFVSFRDRLRGSLALRNEYNTLKEASTNLTDEDYRNRKAEFIERVLEDKH